MEKFYEIPTQIAFWESEEQRYIGGIAFQDTVICGDCGYFCKIQDVIDNTPEGQIPIYEYDYWVSLDAEICGDERPCIAKLGDLQTSFLPSDCKEI